MGKLYITEFASIGQIGGVGDFQAAKKPTAYQVIDALDGTNKQSAAFNAATKMVRVVSDVAAFCAIGDNPNVTSGIKIYLPAGVAEYLAIENVAHKVAAMTAA